MYQEIAIPITPTEKEYSKIIRILNTKVNFDNWESMRNIITQFERLGHLDTIVRAKILRRMIRRLEGV